MHALSIIKNAALHALDDDDEEPEKHRMAEYLSIAGPRTTLELVAALELLMSVQEEFDEMKQVLRELTEYVDQQPGEEARVLAMKAKFLLLP
ncbi:hypothetical protein [Noviherbaspirillum malthae]|uniref:hypothetical protein n=1 Tax=Noviherbaspirillum malthae TaxID=1260987 RepID=UPI001890A22A|nr:hypothetical protein [Noviherbaspirillum malthae]